ncbi:MAG: hypothetical protein LC808_06375, partial [Actinobacteria bacterium]|nr:hypothetical protein [Actinomycetota bacterium]
MKKLIGLLAVVSLAAGTQPASADSGHERPRITVMKWEDPPVTAAGPDCDDPSQCHEEILIIKAHDPDSSITEVQVWFGEGAPFAFAHTYCVQGKAPGRPARLKIGVSYEEAGDYVVRAVAYSHKRCLGHEAGDGHPALHSKVK